MRWHRRFFRRGLTERQLDAELRFHLEQQAADYVAAGMTPEEARRRARLEFGGLEQVKEECREVGASRFIETLIQDVRYGGRMLRKNPAFTVAAVLTLGLGIGAATAIFNVTDETLFSPLPLPEPQQLVAVYSFDKKTARYLFEFLSGLRGFQPAQPILSTSFRIRPASFEPHDWGKY